MLILGGLTLTSFTYCYDIPGPIHELITNSTSVNSHFPNVTSTQYSLQYAVYSYPNIIVSFLGGMFIDKYGNRYLILK